MIGSQDHARAKPKMINFASSTGAVIEEHAWVDPEAAFAPQANQPFSIWLDSGGHFPTGKYSYIVTDPFDRLIQSVGTNKTDETAPLDKLAQMQTQFANPWRDMPADIVNQIPEFRGGCVGVFGYELGSCFEEILTKAVPPDGEADIDVPDLTIGFYAHGLAFDPVQKRCFIFSTGDPEHTVAKRSAKALADIEIWKHRLQALQEKPEPPWINMAPLIEQDLTSSVTADKFIENVERIKQHISQGDIFQANLAQRYQGQLKKGATDFQAYQNLRRISPAPFGAFAQFGDWSLASSSPEAFIEIEGQTIRTRPIKGTLPRSDNPIQDAKLASDLLGSEKDRAENIMIVDLLRNDLARICELHSIEVEQLCALESYANVHHLVSTISGKLKRNQTIVDVLAASFPGGSITGAPKIRAMEIIADIEKIRRGPFCGSLGYIGFDGRTNLNISIRSIVFSGQSLQFHVGGGITSRSDAIAEYNETLDKAAGIFAALGFAAEPKRQAISHGVCEPAL